MHALILLLLVGMFCEDSYDHFCHFTVMASPQMCHDKHDTAMAAPWPLYGSAMVQHLQCHGSVQYHGIAKAVPSYCLAMN